MLLFESQLHSLPRLGRGKVRDIYAVDGDKMMILVSDRLSAFDVVLPDPIPDKGRILTQLSNFWFRQFADVENHLLETDVAKFPAALQAEAPLLAGRSVLVRKCEVIPFECVARGYLVGSGWSDYKRTGAVCGIPLPKGLREADRLTEPIFTPATKAESGHDQNISRAQLAGMIGTELARELERLTLTLYRFAHDYAASKSLILADTKFEFGMYDGRITLIDEILTPDSSRYWDAEAYKPGSSPASFDKQYVRDFLTASGWNKEPPAPALPPEVVKGTSERYREAYKRIVGKELS